MRGKKGTGPYAMGKNPKLGGMPNLPKMPKTTASANISRIGSTIQPIKKTTR